jgi:hypothetical protein
MSKYAFLASLALVVALGGCASGELANQQCCDENLVSCDGRPIPGNGDYGVHLEGWADTQLNRLGHTAHTLNYMFLATNSEDVPYEQFWCDRFPKSMTNMSKTFDMHFFNYDWDDPFNGERW